jgi:5,10-methenyltetrahydrofolate synthetase
MTGESRIPRSSKDLPPCTTAVAAPALEGDKAGLRKALTAARCALDPTQKQVWDAQICANLLAWWERGKPAQLGVYWPLAGEPDLHPAYAELARAGVRLALPVVHEKNAALGFAEWEPGEAMVRDRMGVAVPELLRPVDRPAALVIPCLGFNQHGYRLGYGGGYYDRTLAPHPRPLAVGIAYALAAACFADDPHDVALDLIITELP